MRTNLKRVALSLAALTAASAGLVLSSTTASAAGTLAGPATLSPSSGGLTTNYTLTPPANSFCAGDSAAGGYSVRTFMTDQDPTTLSWSGAGPFTASGFTQPLFTATGSPITAVNTAPAAPGAVTGRILALPQLRFEALGAGTIPDGEYTLGIACVAANATDTFYTAEVRFTSDNWAFINDVTVPPTVGDVTVTGAPGSQVLTVPFSSVPKATSYDVIATPQAGGDPTTVNVAGAGAGEAVFNGLAPGIYDVQALAKNATSTGPLSAIVPLDGSGFVIASAPPLEFEAVDPGGDPVEGADVLAGSDVTLTIPVPVPAPGETGARVDIEFRSIPTPLGFVIDDDPTSNPVTGQLPDEDLTPGIIKVTVTVPSSAATGPHAIVVQGPGPFVLVVNVNVALDKVLYQEIDVTRPVGQLVLTQRCGVNIEFLELVRDPALDSFPGFMADLPLVPAAGPIGTAPEIVTAATLPDNVVELTPTGDFVDPAEFADYPGPAEPVTYSTNCGIDLGLAKPVSDGTFAGQYFTAEGVLNQVSVFDTRDTGEGWTVNVDASDFVGADASAPQFDGNYLGWLAIASPAPTTAAGYTQDIQTPQAVILPGSGLDGSPFDALPGLEDNPVLATAGPGDGLGVTKLDARLALLIPTTAPADDYTSVLTLTIVSIPAIP